MTPPKCAAANGGEPSRLQSAHLVAAVAELATLSGSIRNALLIALLMLVGCSKQENRMTRLQKYADDKQIVYITEFPVYLQVEIVGIPGLRGSMEKWLLDHGFKKGHGAAFAPNGKLVSQEYLFGDTFDIDLASLAGNIILCGYGIRTPDQNVEPTLRELIQFIDAHYKTTRKELKSS